MYHAHFSLHENPFSLTPDPRFLFLSQRHREALAHLLYGMGERGGFVQLTGEVGTGKTTLCRCVLEQAPEEVEVALILNPKLTAVELVATICDELRISYPQGTESIKVLVDLLNRHLLDAHAGGRRTVLMIDEAQNLSSDVLEQIRLLTNLETSTQRLLQVVLIGQPELHELMSRLELRQLAQRVTARYHLTPLTRKETAAYVRHRLAVAGCDQKLFTRGALRLVDRISRGIPRVINIVCDRAMLGAYAEDRSRVGKRLVRRAAGEVSGRWGRPATRGRTVAWGVLLLLLALLIASLEVIPRSQVEQWWSDPRGSTEVSAEASATLPPPGGAAPENSLPAAPEPPPPVATPKASVQGTVADPGPRDLSTLIADEDVKTDAETAFAALFRYWDLPYADLRGAQACDKAASAGLRCLEARGNWTGLRHYDLPAIIVLRDPSGQEHYAVVAELGQTEVSLDFGGSRFALPCSEVERYWYGRFILLWRAPKLVSASIQEGSSGPDVLWLRAALDRWEGAPAEPDRGASRAVFDGALRERVERFQRSRALRPDGVVGEQTLIQLNTAAADRPVPRLGAPRQ